MRILALIMFATVLADENALAQQTTPAVTREADELAWSFTASIRPTVPTSQSSAPRNGQPSIGMRPPGAASRPTCNCCSTWPTT